MNIRSKVKVIGLGLWFGLGLGDWVSGVSYAPLSSAPLVAVYDDVSGSLSHVYTPEIEIWQNDAESAHCGAVRCLTL